MRCGACCACFQVAFPASECDLTEAGIVPVAFTVLITPDRRAMRGTEKRFNKRCLALTGVIGVAVTCDIYAWRPSSCHLFRISWGTEPCAPNRNCDRARATYGLSPFSRF
jgi:Fe-S-cluster containining protein